MGEVVRVSRKELDIVTMRTEILPLGVLPGDLLMAGGPTYTMYIMDGFYPIQVSSLTDRGRQEDSDREVPYLRWMKSSESPPSSPEVILLVTQSLWCIWRMHYVYKVVVLDEPLRSVFVVRDENFLRRIL